MSILLAVILLLGIWTLGWLVTTFLNHKNRLEKIGLSFLLGSWLLTLEMMSVYIVQGTFSSQITWLLLLGSLVTILLCLFLSGRFQQVKKDISDLLNKLKHSTQTLEQLKIAFKNLTRLEVIMLSLVFAYLLYTLLSNFVWPVSDWDAVALYDFRAILIKTAGSWQEGKELGYFYHYPPFTSLLHGALYQLGFERVKVVYTLFYASLLIIFYSFLREKVSRAQTLVGVALLTIAPLIWGHATVAYTNLPYTIYFCLALFFAWRWIEKSTTSDLLLSILLLSASIWVRQSEPFWLIVLGLQVIGAIKTKKWKTLGFLVPIFILFGVLFNYWPYYTRSLQLPPPPVSVDDAANYSVPFTLATVIHHGFQVVDHFIQFVLTPLQVILLPFIVVALFDKSFLNSSHKKIVIGTLLFMMVMVVGGTYYFSFTYKSWHLIGESLTRLVMVVVPVLIYVIGLSSFWSLFLAPISKPKRKPQSH